MGYIYKITNRINGKIYIGKTEEADPENRWKQHLQDAHRRRNEKRPLYDAMNKYGVENFTFKVIDECNNSDKLCEMEKNYILLYRSYVGFSDSNGYNATIGGDGRPYLELDETEVVGYHLSHNLIVGDTAKFFNTDPASIKKILKKHDVTWLSNRQITAKKYCEQFGGLAMIDPSTLKILHIYQNLIDVTLDYPKFKTVTLAHYSNPNDKSHHFGYGYLWYRLTDLTPEILKINNADTYKDLLIC